MTLKMIPENPRELYEFLKKEIQNITLTEEKTYFALSNKWLTHLKVAAKKCETEFSTKIRNGILLDEEGLIKETLKIPHDYVIITSETNSELLKKYGGGPSIPVFVTRNPITGKPMIEPNRLQCIAFIDSYTFNFYLPFTATVKDAKEIIGQELNLKPKMFNLRSYINGSGQLLENYELIYKNEKMTKPFFYVEKIRHDGTFPPEYTPSVVNSGNIKDSGIGMQLGKKEMNGLINKGNTCYANATLQCLSHIPLFYKTIQSEKSAPFVNEVKFLFKKLIEEEKSPIDPSSFLRKYSEKFNYFSIGTTQDSHEFFIKLLDYINSETKIQQGTFTRNPKTSKDFMNNYLTSDNCSINKLFAFQYKKEIACDKCKKTTVSFPVETCLSVDIPHEINEIVYYIPYERTEKQRAIKLSSKKDIQKTVEEETKTNVAFFAKEENKYRFVKNPDSENVKVLFAYEIPNTTSLYSLANVSVMLKTQKETEIFLPILIEVGAQKKSAEFLNIIATQRLSDYWSANNHSKYAEESEKIISPGSSDKRRVYISEPPAAFTNEEECSFIAKEKLCIKLNTRLTRESEDFDWDLVYQTNFNIQEEEKNDTPIYPLEDLIGKVFSEETLEYDWTCSECGAKSHPKLTNSLEEVPKIFAIRINREEVSDNFIIRNNGKVNVPEELKMTTGDNKEHNYALQAAVLHHGSCQCGHYTAACKLSDGKWAMFNDHEVDIINYPQESLYVGSYLLFYTPK